MLSLVPADAADIRDGADAGLGAVESLRFRTSLFQIVAVALGAMAAVIALLALLPLTRRAAKAGKADDGRLPDRIVLGHAAAELEDVKRQAAIDGWTDGTTARALAALRIVAACAIDRPSSQKPLAPGAPTPEGRLAAAHGWPRQVRISVSSPVTTDDVGRAGSVAIR